MTAKPNILTAIARLAPAERAFLRRDFLAPVAGDGTVHVRIDGIRLELRPSPATFRGWGVFRPTSHRHCKLLRPATCHERQRYLDMFPAVRLILCDKDGDTWSSIPAGAADRRPGVGAPCPLRLATGVEAFDTVVARHDGQNLWHDATDPRADPAAAAYLRRSLVDMLDPARVWRPGLSAAQRAAYALVFRRRADAMLANARQRDQARLRDALAHAGAVLHEFNESPDGYRVIYDVDGRRHTSLVRRDLTVGSAGICLSGEDHKFDLGSLVGVLREGRQLW